jgi:hypothetical protein
MENKSSSDIESFLKEKNLSDVSEIFKGWFIQVFFIYFGKKNQFLI